MGEGGASSDFFRRKFLRPRNFYYYCVSPPPVRFFVPGTLRNCRTVRKNYNNRKRIALPVRRKTIFTTRMGVVLKFPRAYYRRGLFKNAKFRSIYLEISGHFSKRLKRTNRYEV